MIQCKTCKYFDPVGPKEAAKAGFCMYDAIKKYGVAIPDLPDNGPRVYLPQKRKCPVYVEGNSERNLNSRIREYEDRFSYLITDISKETTKDGLKAIYNFDTLVSEFQEIISNVEMIASSDSGGLARIIPGDRNNEQ